MEIDSELTKGETTKVRTADYDSLSSEEWHEARPNAVGRYESYLTEGDIPADVLERLLPGDDILELDEPSVAGGVAYRFAKRAFDVCSCVVALIVLAVPMGIVALKIRVESPGPAIYAQRRVGLNGREFSVYKFRSMYADAEKRGARWAMSDDPRVTPFGRWMRDHRVAPVIIGTPGDGEPTKSLSHPVNSSLDLHKCERRPEPFLVAQTHYTSFQILSFAVFGGLGAARGRRRRACTWKPLTSVGMVV